MADELFPMKSCKIKGEEPVINVTFFKNLDTLEYILGDKKSIAAQKKKEQE